MGGGYYDRAMEAAPAASNSAYSATANAVMAKTDVNGAVLPNNRYLTCDHKTPIVVAMDVTRSRGDDSKILYDKLPMFFGQLMMQKYADDPAISFSAIGDATCGDKAPIQICDFAAGNDLDGWLSKLWLEEGGGGTGQESYELTAFFYARHTKLTGLDQGKKGIFFFTGDEAFYSHVSKQQAKLHIGDQAEIEADVDSNKIFAELQKKYDVYFLFPVKSMEQRRADIDAEILKRLQREGAKSGDVTMSLIWNNRNDLDLHVITPNKEEIYYGHKKSRDGGELDVDMNVRGESTEPVENVYWPKGGAPAGHYKVYVQNYAFHEGNQKPTPYKVAVTINGEAKQYEGVIHGSGAASNTTICEFDYQGSKKDERAYELYSDTNIIKCWGGAIPKHRILTFEDPKAIVDIMLGVISVSRGIRTIEQYRQDLITRKQDDTRIKIVTQCLNQCFNSNNNN